MSRSNDDEAAATFTPAKERLSFKRDGLALLLGAVFFLGLGVLFGSMVPGDVKVTLSWANSATILATAFTVGGIIFPRWRGDISDRAQARLDAIWAAAAERNTDPGHWWQFWDRTKPEVVLSEQEKAEVGEINGVLKHNSALLERVEFITFVFFIAAVVSGGVSIACELRPIFAPG